MGLIKKFLDSRFYLPFVCLVSMTFWLLAYLSHNEKLNIELQSKIENISLLAYGSICALLLVFNRNTFYIIPWVIFIPFVFARPFTAMDIPVCIFYGVGLMLIGLVINIILYRPKLKIGHFFIGLMILCIAFVLGGINVPSENSKYQLILLSACVIAFMLMYTLLASSSKADFKRICKMFTYLGIFLVFELCIYFLIQPDLHQALLQKNSTVGWGISNNIALILLFTFPYTVYLGLTSKGIKTIFYVLVVACQCLGIVFTYSRGATFSMLAGIAVMIPLCIWKAEDRITTSITIGVTLLVLGAVLLYYYKFKNEDYQKFIDVALHYDLDNLNGRTPIYEDCINALKEYPVFGKGVLSTFNEDGTYAWGHSTILQTVRTMGWVGTIAMIIHLIQKYFVLVYRPSLWKVTVAASFAISGLYGLFDVSYYFINYMVVLILCMAVIECLFRKTGEDDYEIL